MGYTNNFFDKKFGYFFSSLISSGLSSKMLCNDQVLNFMLKVSTPEMLEWLGEKKVITNFKQAAKEIPAYTKFLRLNKVKPNDIASLTDFIKLVPISTKENYVKKSKNLKQLCINGKIDSAALLARSSGYSGNATTWAKSRNEQRISKTYAAFGLNMLFQTRVQSTLLINSFNLGSWVSGVDLLLIADTNCTIISPGADLKDCLDIIKTISPEFNQTIIAGTPHFVKHLIDQADEKKLLNKKIKINLLLGAEGFTEGWRNYVQKKIGGNTNKDKNGFIFSAFGASDLGVTGINETFSSVKIRRIALKNKKLSYNLFGKQTPILPMLFQYDPTKFFIEATQSGELLFTNLDNNGLMPLIRYNLHDMGGIISYTKMKSILKKHNLNLNLDLPFPFLFITGRSNGTIKFIGQLIYPEYIQEAIFSKKILSEKLTGVFKMVRKENHQKNPLMILHFQLKEKEKINNDLQILIKENIIAYLCELSIDFPQSLKILSSRMKEKPIQVKVYPYNSYPFHDKIKVKYL